MANSQQADTTRVPVPDLLAHLEQTFGWSEGQAIDALSAYMMSTEAGRALRRELTSCAGAPRAA